MPRRDGTGPMGMGPQTGRGQGMCTGVNAPAYGRGFGRGYGMGNGMRGQGGYGFGFRGGRNEFGGYGGRRGMFAYSEHTTPAPQNEPQALKDHAAYLESELKAVQQRLADLETQNDG